MPVLHMETDVTRAAAQQINLFSSDLLTQAQTLSNSINTLSISWLGGEANSYLAELDDTVRTLYTLQEQVTFLSRRLQEEVQEWEFVDGNNVFSSGVSGLTSDFISDEPFSWPDFWRTLPGGINVGMEIVAKSMTYADYRSVGRWVNDLAGNQRGGWVGRMDTLGHIIESPWVQEGIPFGLNVILDEDFGENNARAIAGELFVFASTRLIPGFGTVMLVSDGIQFGGNLVAGGMELLGYSDEAAWLQNSLEVIDLGGYVEEIGEGIYDTATDWIQNPDQIMPDLQEFSDHMENFGVGLTETGEDIVGWFGDIGDNWF